ncbi:hypothetical protein A3742_05855 [Oleiphilus sp. HI0071]|nr:hypothetical protein A3737_06815 [Oleiphilus sp. HI0065]KZY84328.1 hypothetical protein A3742_05855 [Oleiphilus sp. HI0071]KZZ02428.1 hypothetical protein A3744_11365 [Oleiphilus sp. HI0073]KZZ15789.1 hypothetical protein A3751_00400 [Oleiphilus sp. HI0080]KZZ44819.1 hypothetical protein A3758_02375 [Oleiphilus sp. HI0118]KZZ50306.1 hypothetical protein A3760_02100 [Oleiphilus sp. HI0122]KZZ78895.1 hypothetical protein A3767_01570 [Oleiphilus sp. HI0133]
MIKKSLLIILVFVSAFAVALIATLPASLAWKYAIAPVTKVQSLGVITKAFDGTIWDGRAHVAFRHLEGVFAWELKLSDMWSGSLPVNVQLESTAGALDAVLGVGFSAQRIEVESMRLELSKLNPFLRTKRVKLDGELFAKGLALDLESQTVERLVGRFSWDGGAISYPAGREIHDRIMPAFSGAIRTESDGTIYLGIRDQDASFDTMRGSWQVGGDALWEVTRRVLDIAQEPWSANSSETDVVFKIKKPLSRQLGAG